jgi:gas vesicle protein
MLHKNLKLSKGYGIVIGSVVGLIIGFQITKEQGKKARESAERVRNLEAIDQRNKMIAEGKITQSGEKINK